MSAIPVLKKKLKSVRATGKLSKAMKTVSAAKFSRLSAAWKNYSLYAQQFRFLYPAAQTREADAVVVLGSNRGFCGSFNNELVRYLLEEVPQRPHLTACGEELLHTLEDALIPVEASFVFDDVPAFADCESLLEHLSRLAEGRQDFCIRLVYPEYINTMTQTPTSEYLLLNAAPDPALGGDYLWFPEKKSVMAALYEKGARSILYGAVLKTALGAQAATLMTMRSAYDTAEEYSQTLESEIHRLRQSEVTADVIETSGERGKGETANGQA